MKPFELDPKPINMDIFKGRIEAGAWEVVEKVGDGVGFVIFTGRDAKARALAYGHLISGGPVTIAAARDDELEDIGDLF